MNARKTEEEKMYLERKTREAESLTARMVEESKKRSIEADKLKNELIHARVAEKEAKQKLLNFLSRTTISSNSASSTDSVMSSQQHLHSQQQQQQQATASAVNNAILTQYNNTEASSSPISDIEINSYDLMGENDMTQLSLEIEKERFVLYPYVDVPSTNFYYQRHSHNKAMD